MLSSLLATSGYSPIADAAKGSHYAVLVAGSAGYGNYRHQADVCHAYHVVTAGASRRPT